MAKTKPTLLPRIENKKIPQTKKYQNNKSQTHLAAQKPAKIQINILKNKEITTKNAPCCPEANRIWFIARIFVALVAQDVFLQEN